ncbi:MAG TPA: hypothetical protein VMZ28_27945 [Kofleriaceae bacterium]|nr:hypothetical protein [Kofleriaceae bacterium]
MTRSLFALVFGLALAAGATGCLVRTGPSRGHSHHASHGSDHHCHDRGGKHHKRVCHAHPHGAGHH